MEQAGVHMCVISRVWCHYDICRRKHREKHPNMDLDHNFLEIATKAQGTK